MKPGKTGLQRLLDATGYSVRGLKACYDNEAAFRQEILALVVGLPLSFFIAQTPVQWLILIGPLLLLMIVELLNSAIETTVDRIGPEKHELSGRAKDMGSAAVMITLILIACCWGTVIWTNYARFW